MVSNNGPPLPMPMQVPPGHMVQQIVDEHGILTHVILSPQPPGVHSSPNTVAYYVSFSDKIFAAEMNLLIAVNIPLSCTQLDRTLQFNYSVCTLMKLLFNLLNLIKN